MSFYFKSYNNPRYHSFHNSYEKTFFEIDGYSYILGSVVSESLQRRLAYISKRDSEGNIIIEKGFDIQNSFQGAGWMGGVIHFSNIFKVSNGNLVLTISDENQVAMICLSPDLEQTIWYKKYYDKRDTPLLASSLGVDPYACLLSNDEVFFSITEVHSQNTISVFHYQFLNINIVNGNINFSKKYKTGNNTDLWLRDIVSNGNKVIISGEYQNDAIVMIFNREINIVKKWFFNINNYSSTYKFLSGWKISNVQNNKIMFLGWHSIGNPTENISKNTKDVYDFPIKRYVKDVNSGFIDTELVDINTLGANKATSTWKERYFLLEIDLNTGISKPALLLGEELEFSQTYHEIRYDGNFVYFSQADRLYKISTVTNQNIWGKNLPNHLIASINSDNVIAVGGDFYNYILAKTNKDFSTCETLDLDTFTIGSFMPQLSNFEILLTSNVLPTYIPQEISQKVNILLGSQSDICPPPTYHNLKLTSHNINPQNFIVYQPISINNPVGNLMISNTGTAATTIPPNKLIIATTKGVEYKTGSSTIPIPVGNTSVPIYVSGTPTQLGPFSPEINITNPFVDNTVDHLKIPFNVIQGSPDLQLASHNIGTNDFSLNENTSPKYVGDIVIYNAGNAVGEMMPNITIINKNGVSYKTEATGNYVLILPGSSASFKVFASASNPSPIGPHSDIIKISNSKPVTNPDNLTITFNIINPVLEIMGDVTTSLAAGENYSHSRVTSIRLKNTSNSVRNLDNVKIHASPSIAGGLVFKASGSVPASGEADVSVYVDNMANQALSNFSELIVMDIPNVTVKNTGLFKLKLNVAEEAFNIEVLNDIIITEPFMNDIPFTEKSVGFLQLQNKTKTKPFKLAAGTIIHEGTQAYGVIFKTKTEITLLVDQTQPASVEIVAVSNNGVSQTGNSLAYPIAISSVKANGHRIIFNVIEEPLNAIITDSSKLSAKTFIKDYQIPNEISIGFIKIENRSEVTDLKLPQGSLLHTEPNINGLVFKTKNSLVDVEIPHRESREVEIMVSGKATTLINNFSFPINIIYPEIINENNQHKIIFNVIEDTLNVYISSKRFRFPDLKQGQNITEIEKSVGEIILRNRSQVKTFTLLPKTKIHSDPNISGLIIQTANTESITIDAGDTKNIEVEIKTPAAPTHFGDFSKMIYINGVSNPRYFTIDFDVLGNGTSVDIDDNMSLQSPDFTLQAAGSKGIDSPKGVQLRWMFGGNLGQKHLPKGDADTTNNKFNYNKPEDFVSVYRAPYVRAALLLDLLQGPSLLDGSKQCWIYKVNNNVLSENDIPARFKVSQRTFHVYFRNKDEYNRVIALYNPFEDAEAFLLEYGENVIEIECKEELFFRARPIVNPKKGGTIYFEMLSVEENKLVTPKTLSFRKIMTASEMNRTKLFVENGRSIRYRTEVITLFSFEFEFYSDFIASASYWNSWEDMGKYSLIASSNTKFLNLLLGDINGKWLRYNDGEYVKKQNYIDKWNYSPRPENDFNRGIKQIVERYLDLSINYPTNPRAEEYLDINFSNPDPNFPTEIPGENNGGTLISNLDMLNIAAMDYHVARMLGMGMLDLTSEVTSGDEYIYLTEYKTLKDPQNENLEKNCQLLSISLPTSTNTERLPFPVEIAELYKGMPKNPNEDVPVLYDDEGYVYDGKSRFVSIINKPLPSADVNPPFFANSITWDATQYTLPVYAGLEYAIVSDENSMTVWEKPELSHDDEYFNVTSTGVKANLETVPIMLPENFGSPLYVHRQTKSGKYSYSTYGINIFSRATSSNTSQSIATTIKPKNTLLPPSDVRAWLIQPEKPLMFTSGFEQDKYKEITDEDKTFARISFDYNAAQDLVTYSITPDKNITDDEYINDTTKYFPDEYDVFADQVEVYFRDEIPRSISARLYEVKADNDRLCVVFKTKTYELISTGETLKSELPVGTPIENFIGSLFVVNNKSYVIKSIDTSHSEGLWFTVYKEEVSQTILSGGTISVNFNSLTTPVTSGNDLFAVAENMQSVPVWGSRNPNKFQVPLEFPEIKREIITTTSESGSVQKYLEKSRGYWKQGTIDKYLEKKDENVLNSESIHKGIYKITIQDLGLGTPLNETEIGFYEKNNGYVRVFRNKNVSGNTFLQSRDVLKVIRTEPFGRYLNLYVYDSEFKFDENGNPSGNIHDNEIQTGSDVSINYYPSYFLYLYKNVENNLTKDTVLPTGDQISKQTIFGLRTVDIDNKDINGKEYKSRFSVPSLMVGLKITLPQQPEQPKGSLYATRPDFYGKSTYSFTTKFKQRPYSVQFYRTDNNALLSALYEQEKMKEISGRLSLLGGSNERFLANRWINFFDFETLKSEGKYKTYPEDTRTSEEYFGPAEELLNEKSEENNELSPIPIGRGYALPLPDKKAFFEGINNFIKKHKENTGQAVALIKEVDYGTLKLDHIIIPAVSGVNEEMLLIDFIKETLDYTFVPLTEIPVIYQHVKQTPHLPFNKKQNIRDKSGYLLKTTDPEFDMAPMMTILDEKENTTLFTDFTLNGTTNGLYFYSSREIGSQMKMSELSKVLGPVKLVDSNPPEAPKILSGLPILENKTLGIAPKIKIEVLAFPDFARISRINIYRTTNRLDAESVLAMKQVKTALTSEIELSDNGAWSIYDELEDFDQIPFGDTFYYRVTVEKEIQYADPKTNPDGSQNIITDYAPSQASKILALMLAETSNPESPDISYSVEPYISDDEISNITLKWEQTCYKGKYHFYMMSSTGNWKEIARIEVDKNDTAIANVFILVEGVWTSYDQISLSKHNIWLPFDYLGLDSLPLYDKEGNRIYNHFKVVAENTSGMFSTEEKIFTIYRKDDSINLSEVAIHDLERYWKYFDPKELKKNGNLYLPPFQLYKNGEKIIRTETRVMNDSVAIEFLSELADSYIILPEIYDDLKNPHAYNVDTGKFCNFYRIADGINFMRNSVKKAIHSGAAEVVLYLSRDLNDGSTSIKETIEANFALLEISALCKNDRSIERISIIYGERGNIEIKEFTLSDFMVSGKDFNRSTDQRNELDDEK
jgi:hypothetical protein